MARRKGTADVPASPGTKRPRKRPSSVAASPSSPPGDAMPAPAAAVAPPRILSLPTGFYADASGARIPWFERAAELGFSHVLAPATLLDEGIAAIGTMARVCREHGLGLLLDVDVAVPLPADAPIRAEHPDWFHALPDPTVLPDPRRPAAEAGVRWRLHDDAVAPEALAWWCQRLRDALQAGATGLRLLSLEAAPAAWWAHLVDGLHGKAPQALLL